MKILSWDGNNINDGTNYDAVLNANFYGLPGIRAILGYRRDEGLMSSSVSFSRSFLRDVACLDFEAFALNRAMKV